MEFLGKDPFRWKKRFAFFPIRIAKVSEGRYEFLWFSWYETRKVPNYPGPGDFAFERRRLGTKKAAYLYWDYYAD